MDCEADIEFSENELQLMQTLFIEFGSRFVPTNEDEINRIVEERIPKKTKEKVAWV